MVILVTGSSGRVGHAIARLLAREHDARGLDLVPGPFTTDRGSILDPRRMRLAAVGADAIVHVASLHVPQLQTHSEGAFAATNVEGTRILLEAALPVEHFGRPSFHPGGLLRPEARCKESGSRCA
jgi:UDP-glucose 4-epimerase